MSKCYNIHARFRVREGKQHVKDFGESDNKKLYDDAKEAQLLLRLMTFLLGSIRI